MGLRKTAQVAVLTAVLVAVTSHTVQTALTSFSQGCLCTSLAYGFLSLMLAVCSAIGFDMVRLNPADSHTVQSLLWQYFFELYMYIRGWYIVRRLHTEGKDIRKQQMGVFWDIINSHKGSAYGIDLKLGELKSFKDFGEKVPFSAYADVEPYIQRMLKGEMDALTTIKIKLMCYTSGTTGRPKVFLCPSQMPIENFVCCIYYKVTRSTGRNLGRPLILYHDNKQLAKVKDVPVRTLSSIAYGHKPYFLDPVFVYDIIEEQPFLYIMAVLGLREKELNGMKSTFGSMAYSFFSQIENKWQTICEDIEKGEIDSNLKISDKTRQAVNKFLIPDPERAAFLRREFRKGMVGIARRVWPRMASADMVATGALAHSVNVMKGREMLGIPFFSAFFSASECMAGINTSNEMDDYTYTLYYLTYFFEWIPEDNINDDKPETLLTDQLEVGKSYEMVVTTYSGLVRFRMGEVFRIVKKINQCPVYEYGYRTSQMLDIAGEKLTEVLFAKLVESFFERKGLDLIDYTACESTHTRNLEDFDKVLGDLIYKPMCYLIMVDVRPRGRQSGYMMPAEFEKELDDYFGTQHYFYGVFRKSKALGSLRLAQVEECAFEELKAESIRVTQTQQYKTPRVLRKPELLRLMMSRIVKAPSNGFLKA